jgi:hypothetical protein
MRLVGIVGGNLIVLEAFKIILGPLIFRIVEIGRWDVLVVSGGMACLVKQSALLRLPLHHEA